MKNMRSSESVDLGKRLLDRSLKDLGSSLRKVGKVRLREALDELGLEDPPDLYEQLGLGERLAPLTARFLIGLQDDEPKPRPPAWSSRVPKAWSSAMASAATRSRETMSWAI